MKKVRIDRGTYGNKIHCTNGECPGHEYHRIVNRVSKKMHMPATMQIQMSGPTDVVVCRVCGTTEPRFVEGIIEESHKPSPSLRVIQQEERLADPTEDILAKEGDL